MNASTRSASITDALAPLTHLGVLAQRAIAASSALTSACVAGHAVTDAQFAHFNHEAWQARENLFACLERDHGIDAAMADQLGALLYASSLTEPELRHAQSD